MRLRYRIESGHYRTHKLNFQKLKGDPDKVGAESVALHQELFVQTHQVVEYFEFEKEISKLDESNRLFLVLSKFADIDLHPDAVPYHEINLAWICPSALRSARQV